MQTPQETLSSALNRASEITWWNRNLTKITRTDEIDGADGFLRNDLIETKGPFVELVDPPAPASESATDFLERYDYADEVVDAVVEELFGGDETGHLYRHQSEMIEAVDRDTDGNILTVPTATGKTEAFLLPVLNDCLQEERDGTKAIVVYPMKTLAVDQLNRLIRYLHVVNRSKDKADRITVGIWDGDTATTVGDRKREIEPGSYVRGLECPQTGSKLTIAEDGVVEADGRRYPWVKVTRDRVKDGADILLTNPEAIDHAFVNRSEGIRGVFGNGVGDHPVKHVVFDEAHVWSGIKGAAVRLLVDRLTHFYGPSDPQVSLVSATIRNPGELASRLTGQSEDDINVIDFTARDRPVVESGEFDRLTPTTLEELLNTLLYVYLESPSESEFSDARPNLQSALATAQEVGLVTQENRLTLPDEETWLTSALEDSVEEVRLRSLHGRPDELLGDEESRAELHESILDDAGLESDWYEFVVDNVPEVIEVAEWFDSDTMGNVEFKHYDGLVDYFDDRVTGDPEEYISTVLGFGRLAGVVTEKYHSFLKPPLKMYYCPSCRSLSRADICQECGERIEELRFCENCDHPFLVWDDETEGPDSENSGGEAHFVPLGESASVERCPGCNDTVGVSDVEVPTSTLLSFMLSEMCRVAPSEKVLVFSDSHSAAESVAKQIQQTEYGLMAATLYVDFLKRRGGIGGQLQAYRHVAERLRDEYWKPFFDRSLSSSGSAYNMIEQLQDDVVKNADLYNCGFLFDSTLVTSDVLYESSDDAFELLVGHTLWEVFASSESVEFTKSGVTLGALPREKVHQKVRNKLPYCTREVSDIVDGFLFEFLDAGVIHEKDYESLQLEIENGADSEEDRQVAIDYINAQREEIASSDALPEGASIQSGVFVRRHNQDRTNLRLLTHVALCTNCHAAFPALEGEGPGDTCFECGEALKTFRRYDVENGEYEGKGYADVDDESPWALDHWAHDITRPLRSDEIDFVTVGIHKGNIPATVRGIIEEGFRKDDPEINVVSSTPTMELGVDIGTLDTVAQVGMPPTLTNYVQRSGRTGRSRGSSSLVLTAIRGRHPVDNHFYQDLTRFFSEFQPVRVPPAYEFEQLLAGHVVTEVMGHMARNPHKSNVYERSYSVQSNGLDVGEFVDRIEEQLEELQSVITGDRESVLRDHVRDVFGEEGVRVFDDVFHSKGTVSLSHRVEQVFEPLRNTDNDSVSVEDLTDEYGRLDAWLRQLGYLANYRDFGHQFPVTFTGYESSIRFESTGRLYDMFPGQENGRGAVFSMGGRDYLVDEVQAGRRLTELRLCTDDECDWPYQSYTDDLNECPHCGSELTATPIHEVASVHCRPAYKGEQYWNTRGLQITHTELTPTPDTTVESEDIFLLPAEVMRGAFHLTEFVYAYERRHASGNGVDVRRSEASVTRDDTEYAPIGRQFQATGIQFDFPKAEIAERLDTSGEDVPWAALMVSFEQALQRAIAVSVNVELDDFEVRSSIDNESLTVAVVDGRSGGNGVAWEVAETLHSRILPEVEEVLACENCYSYCEECLLLPRTPAFYLDNDLLDKQVARDFVHGD